MVKVRAHPAADALRFVSLAYLFELEGAVRVILPDATEVTPATVVPPTCQFRLLLLSDT